MFSLGANLPWIDYGGDFGANAWRPQGGCAASGIPQVVRARIAELRACGVSTLRWFVFCDGRAGIRFAGTSEPLGLDDRFMDDFQTVVEFVSDSGLTLVPTLLDFHWCSPAQLVNGVLVGGRGESLADSSKRRWLLERVLAPVFDRFGREASIAGWDLMNEPEWAVRSVGRASVTAFIAEAAALAHQHTAQPVTTGLASSRGLPLVRDAGLDFYQVHWYDKHRGRARLDRPTAQLDLDRPIVLGEFPTRGSARSPDEIIEVARDAGYQAAWFWSVLAEDAATDVESAIRALARLRERPADRGPAQV